MNTNTLGLIFNHMVTLSHLVNGKRIAGMKALMCKLRKEAVVGVTCWEVKSHLFKALVLLTFTYGTNFFFSHWKVSRRA